MTPMEQALRLMLQLDQAQPNRVVWARSPDYRQQLYVSGNFSVLWQLDATELYQHPDRWDDCLINDDEAWWRPELERRKEAKLNEPQSEFYYRFRTPSGEVLHAHDQALPLGQAIVGVSTILPAEAWYQQVQGPKTPSDPQVEALIRTLVPPAKPQLQAKPSGGLTLSNGVQLSKREQQVVYHALQGRTALQTAQALFISKRTVETHLENLKAKLRAASKLELVNQLHQLVSL